MAERKHPGISMHKIPIDGGFIGLVFTVGCALIFLLGLPALWYFVVFSAALGVGLGLVFHLLNRPGSPKPLSIVSQPQERAASEQISRSENRGTLLQAMPTLYPS